MARDFYWRLAMLTLLTFGLALSAALAGILPSYFLSSVENNAALAKLRAQKGEQIPPPDQETLSVINDLNRKIDIVKHAEDNKFTPSEKVINAVILKKTPSIKITSISYENDPVNGKKISVQGNAPSREVLLSFRLALERDVSFKKVDLPISNFVKGSNIKFYLSLIPS